MDIGEGMYYGECCEVCKPGNSQTCTPGANNTFYVNKKIKKIFKKSLVKVRRMEQMGSKREACWQTLVKRLLQESKEHRVV